MKFTLAEPRDITDNKLVAYLEENKFGTLMSKYAPGSTLYWYYDIECTEEELTLILLKFRIDRVII